jgi:type II secretory pathway pseudopilin PulG
MKKRSGFTIIEVLIIVGLFMILVGIGTINTSRTAQTVSLQSVYDEVVAAVGAQQLYAMTGRAASSGTNTSYGVRFEPDQYILFAGSYVAGDSANVVTQLPPNMSFSTIDVPSQVVIYATESGQIQGYDSNQATVVLTDQTTGKARTLHWNTLGVLIP